MWCKLAVDLAAVGADLRGSVDAIVVCHVSEKQVLVVSKILSRVQSSGERRLAVFLERTRPHTA